MQLSPIFSQKNCEIILLILLNAVFIHNMKVAFSSEWMWYAWKVSNSSDIIQYMNKYYKSGVTYADFAQDVCPILMFQCKSH